MRSTPRNSSRRRGRCIRSAGSFVPFVAAALLAQPFRSNVEIVVVSCAVVDANGATVTGLTRDDFRVYDNGTRRSIENLWFDADQPVTLGVILDASESQKDQIAEHRETAARLLEQILKPGDHAFVISVDSDIRLPVDFSGSAAEVRRELAAGPGAIFGEPCALRSSNIPGYPAYSACGSSPLWNAIYDAARIKLQPVTGNKAALILTDGFDSGSSHGWTEAAEALNRADASLYAIQYKSGLGGSFAPDLYRLVTETAGARFHLPGGDEREIVSRIETDLRHRYVIGFRPDRMSAKIRHEVRIEVTRPGITVRARKAYFYDPR
jgi:VWFA-related protein